MNYGSLIISLIVTAFAYLLVPVIVCLSGKKRSKKALKIIVVVNGIIVWLIFQIININLTGEPSSSYAVFLWSFIGYALVKKHCLADNCPETSEAVPATEVTELTESIKVPKSSKATKGFIAFMVIVVIIFLGIGGFALVSQFENSCKQNGHTWVEATCEQPKYCSVCGEVEGDASDHVWSPPDSNKLRKCIHCGAMRALTLPESGKVFIGSTWQVFFDSGTSSSTLTIHSSINESCYVKLKDAAGTDAFSFFVRAGDSATVSVPAKHYYIYFAYGTEWYGPEYLFGDNTTYTKDDELLDFENYTWTYTLYPVADGNFSETPISAEEFQ